MNVAVFELLIAVVVTRRSKCIWRTFGKLCLAIRATKSAGFSPASAALSYKMRYDQRISGH